MNRRQVLHLSTAQKYAEKIREWLSPYCSRIELAGDVRRERPTCEGIVFVCIPKENELLHFLTKYVEDSKGRAEWINILGSGMKFVPVGNEQRWALHLPKCRLDLHLPKEEMFISRWIERTGSEAHNRFMEARANKLNGRWDYFGFSIQRERITLESEGQFYEALKLPFIEPKDREEEFLKTLLPLPRSSV